MCLFASILLPNTSEILRNIATSPHDICQKLQIDNHYVNTCSLVFNAFVNSKCCSFYGTDHIILLCTLVGCSSDGLQRASIEGSVTIDGQPLEKGTVNWYPLEGQGPTAGADVLDGKYKLGKKKCLSDGFYRVEIQG